LKKDNYTYPSIFTFANDGISIGFPDISEAISCAKDTKEAIKCAEEVLGLCLVGREIDKEEIPQPTHIKEIVLESNQKMMLIEVYMPLCRDSVETIG
jgi:predicted RNase H-like HicB family nuclease